MARPWILLVGAGVLLLSCSGQDHGPATDRPAGAARDAALCDEARAFAMSSPGDPHGFSTNPPDHIAFLVTAASSGSPRIAAAASEALHQHEAGHNGATAGVGSDAAYGRSLRTVFGIVQRECEINVPGV